MALPLTIGRNGRRRFGRRPSPRDDRDRRFELAPRASARRYRYWALPRRTLDQLETPHCVGYASVHMLAASPFRQGIDPDGLYELCKLIDGYPDEDGTFVRSAFQILKKLGFVRVYKWARSLAALDHALLEIGPVVVGTNWYEGMEDGGVVSTAGDMLGGHAWLVYGVNLNTGNYAALNSWGREWGDNGRFIVPRDVMQQLLDEDGEVCLATETDAYQQALAYQEALAA